MQRLMAHLRESTCGFSGRGTKVRGARSRYPLMTHVLHRLIGHDYPVAVRGEGVYIYDDTGKRISTPPAAPRCRVLAIRHKDVLAAMRAQLDKHRIRPYQFLHHAGSGRPGRRPRRACAGRPRPLIFRKRRLGSDRGRAENGAAVFRRARRTAAASSSSRRRQSYHGITLRGARGRRPTGARKQFAPLLIETHHVSPVYEYRNRRAGETPQAYGERLAQELEAKINELGGENVIAFIAETVVGATLGAAPPVPGYFRRDARDLRPSRHSADPRRSDVRHGPHRHAACLRAGRHRAGSDGDRQGAGRRLPCRSARCWSSDTIYQTIADGSRVFQHSHTYTGHPLACAARARGAAGDPARQSAGQCARPGRAADARACRNVSAIIPSSATCGAAACSRASSWSPTAPARNRSIRRARPMRR